MGFLHRLKSPADFAMDVEVSPYFFVNVVRADLDERKLVGRKSKPGVPTVSNSA